jgi:xanthine/uracil permease
LSAALHPLRILGFIGLGLVGQEPDEVGTFTMGGIGTATFGAIILYQILGWNSAKQ